MKTKTRIVIADDHTILREGLKSLLNSLGGFVVAGEAADGLEAIRSVEKACPDVLLIDLSMPKMTGMDAIREIRKRSPATKIVVLTVHDNEEFIAECLDAGAQGYILKDASQKELVGGIRTVLSGKPYLSPGVSQKVIEGYLAGKKTLHVPSAMDALSQREREILKLVAEGHSNKSIAGYLCISSRTVEKHRANLMSKLELHNASELTAFAITRGLVSKSQ